MVVVAMAMPLMLVVMAPYGVAVVIAMRTMRLLSVLYMSVWGWGRWRRRWTLLRW